MQPSSQIEGDVLKRTKKQREKVNDLIDKALEKHYLEIVPQDSSERILPGDVLLKTNGKGREFMYPLNFIESTAQKYGYIASMLSVILTTLILDHFNIVATFLSKIRF